MASTVLFFYRNANRKSEKIRPSTSSRNQVRNDYGSATFVFPFLDVVCELFWRRFQPRGKILVITFRHLGERLVQIRCRRGCSLVETFSEEMVRFMLDNSCFETFPVIRVQFALQVDSLKLDFLRSWNNKSQAWIAETAFFSFLDSLEFKKRRVNENVFLIFLLALTRRIDYDKLIGKIDLIRRQTDAVVRVHQIKHFSNDVTNCLVNLTKRLTLVGKHRMRIFNNAHDVFLFQLFFCIMSYRNFGKVFPTVDPL